MMSDFKLNKFLVLGVMSGTSLDGIDMALIEFNDTINNISFEIISAETVAYNSLWKEDLQNSIYKSEKEIELLNSSYGKLLGNEINLFLNKNNCKPQLIASHGHTVFHKPKEKNTLQIGNGPEIFKATSIPTVCDFRVQDVILNGQGAPLVPIGDLMLFNNYSYCLNLGGFANISYQESENRKALDICAVNIVLNDLTEKLGFPYDDEGRIAQNGKVNDSVLKELNEIDFYKLPPPKSLGKEWVDEKITHLLENLEPTSAIATYTEHAAIQIGKTLKQNKNCLVTGGGAFNKHLIKRISHHSTCELILPHKMIINYKEALVFGLLGLLKWNDQINCLASVTGADHDHSSGVIYR